MTGASAESRGDASMRLQFIVFARALCYATQFRGRHAHVEVLSMAKAILQQAVRPVAAEIVPLA
jgi:hypothetical protein